LHRAGEIVLILWFRPARVAEPDQALGVRESQLATDDWQLTTDNWRLITGNW
jgi:hypothetical protein